MSQPNVKIPPQYKKENEEKSRGLTEMIELFIRNISPSELNIKDAAVLNKKTGNLKEFVELRM